MANFLSPDVYNENSDSVSLNTEVALGVAGFVGIAQRGPINEAVRIQSWNQYINIAIQLHHGCGSFPAGISNQLNGILRKPRRLQCITNHRCNGQIGMNGIASAF